jgi:hypothetical protein
MGSSPSEPLFALSGSRHYRRTSPVARMLAGTALRPRCPRVLPLMESFALEEMA